MIQIGSQQSMKVVSRFFMLKEAKQTAPVKKKY